MTSLLNPGSRPFSFHRIWAGWLWKDLHKIGPPREIKGKALMSNPVLASVYMCRVSERFSALIANNRNQWSRWPPTRPPKPSTSTISPMFKVHHQSDAHTPFKHPQRMWRTAPEAHLIWLAMFPWGVINKWDNHGPPLGYRTADINLSRTPTHSSPDQSKAWEEEAGIFLRDKGWVGEDVVMKTPSRSKVAVWGLHCTHILLFSLTLHVKTEKTLTF